MNSTVSNNTNASLNQLLIAFSEYQKQQTEFARQQQKASERIESCLHILSKTLLRESMPAESQESTENSGRSRESTQVNLSEPNVASQVAAPAKVSPYKSLDQPTTPKTSLYKTAEVSDEKDRDSKNDHISPVQPLDREADSGSEPEERQSAANQSRVIDQQSESNQEQATASSPYRTLEQEQGFATTHPEEPQDTAEINPPVVIKKISVEECLGVVGLSQQSAAQKSIATDRVIAGVPNDNPNTEQVADPANEAEAASEVEVIRDTVKEIEGLLPTVDQFTTQLMDSSDQQLKEVSRAEEGDPKVTKKINREVLPKTWESDETETTAENLTSVKEAIAMEATDERSLLDQIHRFTETLSESTSFWKQVTIPQAEQEQQSPAQPIDPTVGIAAQYENSSRSPYSH